MRVLLLCTKFPMGGGERYLTNELAAALAAAGHSVQVCVTEWSEPPPRMYRQALPAGDILVIPSVGLRGLGAFIERASKWLMSPLAAWWQMRRALGRESYDLLIAFTPCVTVYGQILWYSRRHSRKRMLFVHDLFPYHHRAIGLVPKGPVFELARWFENSLLRRFDIIGCASPRAMAHVAERYDLGASQRVEVHPIWGEITAPPVRDRRLMRERYKLPADRKIAVFGGQITEGRGIETLLAAAPQLPGEVALLIIGDGRLAAAVEQSQIPNLIYRKRIPREDYLALLGACDIGVVCTVSGVGLPTFPSKTIDYLRCGLSIVAAVEPDDDYGSFVAERGLGLVVPADDASALAEAISKIASDCEVAKAMVRSGKGALESYFDVRRAVARIEAAVGGASEGQCLHCFH